MTTLLTTLKTRLTGGDKSPDTSKDTSTDTAGRIQAIQAWLYSERTAKLAFFAVAGVLAAYVLALIGADTVLAQADIGNEYQGDAVHRTLENVRNYIIGILLLLGAIGFALGLGVKAIAGTNENMHHASHLAMKGGILAVVGSAIVIPVMEIAQGIAEAGSSGGGGG